ncbi:hypothetical protein LMG26684_03190 [Achromobacter mucicolens]|nr:hypothetical protein LMG26684_03190 [Achromobacter mucicolens]
MRWRINSTRGQVPVTSKRRCAGNTSRCRALGADCWTGPGPTCDWLDVPVIGLRNQYSAPAAAPAQASNTTSDSIASMIRTLKLHQRRCQVASNITAPCVCAHVRGVNHHKLARSGLKVCKALGEGVPLAGRVDCGCTPTSTRQVDEPFHEANRTAERATQALQLLARNVVEFRTTFAASGRLPAIKSTKPNKGNCELSPVADTP